jgi:hypothetical protein
MNRNFVGNINGRFSVLALKVATFAMGDSIADVANKNSVVIATLANEIFTQGMS